MPVHEMDGRQRLRHAADTLLSALRRTCAVINIRFEWDFVLFLWYLKKHVELSDIWFG